MIIHTRTPYRVSLFGGGSDYNSWLLGNSGATISFSIQYYSNIFIRRLSPVFQSKYRIRYYNREEVMLPELVQHPIIRHSLNRWISKHSEANDLALDIIHSGDLPAMTGMGTSSAFTVGLVKALESMVGSTISKQELAREAILIEQVLNGETVGYQDQVAASFGGINFVEYYAPNSFRVFPVDFDSNWLSEFLGSLRLVFTGLTRHSSEAASDMVTNIHRSREKISANVEEAHMCHEIISKSMDHSKIGLMLAESWERKKSLSPKISNDIIDEMYQFLIQAGATGGKILGAGGGGFILVYIPQNRISSFLRETSTLTVLPLEIDWSGATTNVLTF